MNAASPSWVSVSFQPFFGILWDSLRFFGNLWPFFRHKFGIRLMYDDSFLFFIFKNCGWFSTLLHRSNTLKRFFGECWKDSRAIVSHSLPMSFPLAADWWTTGVGVGGGGFNGPIACACSPPLGCLFIYSFIYLKSERKCSSRCWLHVIYFFISLVFHNFFLLCFLFFRCWHSIHPGRVENVSISVCVSVWVCVCVCVSVYRSQSG